MISRLLRWSRVLALLAGLGACSSGASAGAASELRLGTFPNLTHGAAIVGVDEGFFTKRLGTTKLVTNQFNAGPAVVEAIFAGALDAAYVGPNPAINAYTKSGGKEIRIIAGAASGGAALVVKPSIDSPADLKGKTLSTPQLGNTQDIALRSWLDSNGLKTDTSQGGDVHVAPQENAQTLQGFMTGDIDGAWVPEPWVSRLVSEGDGKILVDERDLWPGGRFNTVNLVVRTKYLEQNRDAVRALLQGHLDALSFIDGEPAEARAVVNAGLEKLAGKKLKDDVLNAAWKRISFTADPVATSLPVMAQQAKDLGLLDEVALDGIYDLALLNEVLKAAGKPPISTR